MNVANRRWTDDELFAMREEVLQTWPTGSEVDLQDAVAYHKAMADTKRFSKVLASAISSGQTLVQPRAGVPLVENHIELLRYLEQAGADCLPTTIDSYTRQNKYAEAQKGIEESKATGRSMLNGFPAVNHGWVPAARYRVCLGAGPAPSWDAGRRLLSELPWRGSIQISRAAASPITFPTPRIFLETPSGTSNTSTAWWVEYLNREWRSTGSPLGP